MYDPSQHVLEIQLLIKKSMFSAAKKSSGGPRIKLKKNLSGGLVQMNVVRIKLLMTDGQTCLYFRDVASCRFFQAIGNNRLVIHQSEV
jgi:hypothetical protein